MRISRNHAGILIRLLAIMAGSIVTYHLYVISGNHLRATYAMIGLAVLIGEFMWYSNRIYRHYGSFLLSILQGDFTTTFPERGRGRAMDRFYGTLNKITERFKEMGMEKEEQHRFLELVINHVSVGLLTLEEESGKLEMVNEAFTRLIETGPVHTLKRIEADHPELAIAIGQMETGTVRIVQVEGAMQLKKLSIRASMFRMGGSTYKLISVQDIRSELDTNELEAWNKLIRVLTHEIMNSVSPIASLSDTLYSQLSEKKSLAPERLSEGLHAIHRRSSGLLKFTEAYRKLTRIPEPEFSRLELKVLLEDTLALMSEYLKNHQANVKLSQNIEQAVVFADGEMMERVFINLIKNSVEAVQGSEEGKEVTPSIRIDCQDSGEDTLRITLSDNGPGIDAEIAREVFTPFFTTKKEGSGIGLSVCRQILLRHRGNLTMSSSREGTTASLELKKGQ